MGFAEIIAETSRRALTKDDWYVNEGTYVLELRADNLAALQLGSPSVFMVFPMGPEGYTVSRVMRQGITPVLGGLVAEERGLLWRDVTVRGTFGISPRPATDTSALPLAPPGGTFASLTMGGLSGPGWTRRMIYNYWEKYAELKADPEVAGDVTMIWHDMKFDEHWVIVPEALEIDRTPARRHQYPYMLKFKAIADASSLITGAKLPANFFSKLKAILAAVSKALALVTSAINQASEILGEIRYYAAAVDSIIDKIDSIVDAAQTFVDTANSTINSIERAFVTSTLQLMQDMLNLIEGTPELPTSVRQNFQMAMDGLDAIAAQRGAFSTTYSEIVEPIGKSESGARRTSESTRTAAAAADAPTSAAEFDETVVRKGDQDLIDAGVFDDGRSFPNYTGFRQYVVRYTDTLPSIAANVLGDGSRWFDIAVINGLEYPYISLSGAPGTVSPGDTIAIPVIGGEKTGAIATAETGTEPGQDLLGTDIALAEVAQFSAPGRPLVDLQIDKRTYKDFKVISGVANLEQAIQMRLWTEQGTMPLSPSYGLPRVIGVNATGAEVQLLQLSLKQALQQDSRVQQVSAVRVSQVQDVIEFDIDVIPIGESTTQQVTASVG